MHKGPWDRAQFIISHFLLLKYLDLFETLVYKTFETLEVLVKFSTSFHLFPSQEI